MSIQFVHSRGNDSPISIPAIGLDLVVHVPPKATDGLFSIIETINAPGMGPPRHRHPQAEIFRVLEGRYLYELDGRRFYAEVGDVVAVPGNAEHGFINVTDGPARQYIIIAPALDAAAFFQGLAGLMIDGLPDRSALDGFGVHWQVEFLGPPLSLADLPTTA